jgi:hypothetical protein
MFLASVSARKPATAATALIGRTFSRRFMGSATNSPHPKSCKLFSSSLVESVPHKMVTADMSHSFAVVVIEQVNPLAPPAEAKYKFEVNHNDPNEFYISYPRGSICHASKATFNISPTDRIYLTAAYTGARTIGRTSIAELKQHIFRTSNSLRLMSFSKEEGQPEPDFVIQDLSMFRDEKQFEDRIIPMLRAGLQKYYAEVEEEDGKIHETKVSFLCAYDLQVCLAATIVVSISLYHMLNLNSKLPHVYIAAHFSPLRTPPSGRVAVDVQGSPRHHAAAKDSQWVRYEYRLLIQKGLVI